MSECEPLDAALYHVSRISVISSSRIHAKVARALLHLDTISTPRPPVVALSAPLSAANKLLSVAEIVKRQLRVPSGAAPASATIAPRAYQYTRLSEAVAIPDPRPRLPPAAPAASAPDDAYFESLPARRPSRRASPPRVALTTTIYLARQSIPRLKAECGEQIIT